MSVLPRSFAPFAKLAERMLYAANDTKIHTYGNKRLTLDLNLRRAFVWDLIIADVSHAIIGSDFLYAFHLLPDLTLKRLVDGSTLLSVIGEIATLGTRNPSTRSSTTSSPKGHRVLPKLDVFHQEGAGMLNKKSTSGSPMALYAHPTAHTLAPFYYGEKRTTPGGSAGIIRA